MIEPAVATLKSRRLLRKLQYATARITDLVKAVLRLHRPAQDEVGNG